MVCVCARSQTWLHRFPDEPRCGCMGSQTPKNMRVCLDANSWPFCWPFFWALLEALAYIKGLWATLRALGDRSRHMSRHSFRPAYIGHMSRHSFRPVCVLTVSSGSKGAPALKV